MFGNLDGERQELMASGNIEGLIGSTVQFSDKSSALLEVAVLRRKINLNHPHLCPQAVTVSEIPRGDEAQIIYSCKQFVPTDEYAPPFTRLNKSKDLER
jgi:hypothetical protein